MKVSTVLMTIITVVIACHCHSSSPGPSADGDSDVPGDIPEEAVVPDCSEVDAWDLVVSQRESDVGRVSIQVDLESGGVPTSCDESPCINLMVSPPESGGRVEDVVQESHTRISFDYLNSSMPAAGVQLWMQWRVLCTDSTGEHERLVDRTIWICSDTGGALSISSGPCL